MRLLDHDLFRSMESLGAIWQDSIELGKVRDWRFWVDY